MHIVVAKLLYESNCEVFYSALRIITSSDHFNKYVQLDALLD